MAIEDAGFWKQATEWLWGLLALPIALVWNKANGAVQKGDMKEHLDEDRTTHAEFRDTMRELFKAAEADRRRADERFASMQENIHRIHTDLLTRFGNHQ